MVKNQNEMKELQKLIIVGTSKTAQHAYEFVKMYNLYEIVGFSVNEQYKTEDRFMGLPVYSLENLKEEYGKDDFLVFVAVLWNHLNRDRKELYNYCKMKGYRLANLISPNAILRSEIKGDNCWIHDNVIIQNDAAIGVNVEIMAFTLIGANTNVGAHCFFGARSLLAGGCSIGEQCFIGINSTIFDDTTIGDKCIIGACTAVKRNMPNYSRYITASDNITFKQYAETEIEEKLVFAKNKR